MPRLVVLTKGFSDRSYELKVEKTTVGRLEDNTFQIAEGSISSHHCEVLLRAGEIVVRDLNSTNGTFINGQRVSEAVLKPGQILRLGQLEMRLETAEGGAAAPATADKKGAGRKSMSPQGVKLGELDQGTNRPVNLETSVFTKKSNKINKIFLYVGICLAVLIALLIGFAFYKLHQ